MKKRILAALLALGCALLVFTGCGSKKDTTPKDYTQIIHDAREAEDNDYYMRTCCSPCWTCPRAATPILPLPSLP